MSSIENQKILEQLLLIYEKLKKEYQFLELPNDVFNEIVIKHLDMVIKKYPEDKIIGKFHNAFYITLYKQIKEIYDNKTIVLKFIDANLKEKRDRIKCEKELEKLSKFLSKAKIEIDFNLFDELFKENDIINNLCKKVIVKEKEINRSILESTTKNDCVCALLEACCIANDINIIEDNDKELEELIGDFTNDATQMYLNEISKEKLLTLEEEKQLAKLIKQGDKEAKEKLINSNLFLVVSVAKKYVGNGIPFLDLIQEGNAGLIKAAERFDVDRGCKFSTYAIWWIRREIINAIGNFSRPVRIPIRAGDKLIKIMKAKDKLLSNLGREPTIEEVAREVKLSVDTINTIMKYQCFQNMESLDLEINPDDYYDHSTLIDFMVDNSQSTEGDAIAAMMKDEVRSMLDNINLKDRDKVVLEKIYGLTNDGKPSTYDEIGDWLGVTSQRVRQIEVENLDKIRASTKIDGFNIYLDDPEQGTERINNFRKSEKGKKLCKKMNR